MIAVEQLAVDGAPQVGITVTGEAVLSLQYRWEGGDWLPVVSSPRSQQVAQVGTEFYRHFTPPLNVPTTYRVVVESGEVAGPLEASVTAVSESAWLQDPLSPGSAVAAHCIDVDARLMLSAGSFRPILRPQAVDLAQVHASRLPRAAVGQRLAPTDVPLAFYTYAAAQGELARTVRTLFDDAGTVVIRGLPEGIPVDPVAHVVAPDLTESPYDDALPFGARRWDMTITQVAGPGVRASIAWWTYTQVAQLWADALGAGATYDGVIAARPGLTYVDWSREPAP